MSIIEKLVCSILQEDFRPHPTLAHLPTFSSRVTNEGTNLKVKKGASSIKTSDAPTEILQFSQLFQNNVKYPAFRNDYDMAVSHISQVPIVSA